MSTQIHKQNRHKGPRQHYLNKVKFNPDKYKQRNISKANAIRDCCDRCVRCILWKVDYGKYKELRDFAKCHKCDKRNIEQPYHKVCHKCALEHQLCAKCENTYERMNDDDKEKDEELSVFSRSDFANCVIDNALSVGIDKGSPVPSTTIIDSPIIDHEDTDDEIL
mmetsp:Transcript_20807/g.32474  ORF Transcript_20807/g.32474 Transcript_20807/m.32474 type:complete len:165 (+) Transcript_20807:82-576(+)